MKQLNEINKYASFVDRLKIASLAKDERKRTLWWAENP